MGDYMNIEDITVPADFLNLTRDDIDRIIIEMDLEISRDIDEKMYLFDMREELFKTSSVSEIVKNKILAGKTSVKWYQLNLCEDEKKQLKEKLEAESNFYNAICPIDTSQIQSPTKYTCIKVGQDKYIMRIMVPSGTRTVNDGREIRRVQTINNVTVIISLENQYIEIRSNNRNAKRIANTILEPLLDIELSEVNVIGRHGNSLEDFRDSLRNGKFIDVTSVPDRNIELTKEQNELLVSVLQALDEYFIERDIDKLSEELLSFEIGTEQIPFTQLFLSGLSQIGMATRTDFDEDLSCQSLYSMLKSYMTSQTGYITFTTEDDESLTYTIQVGITTNTISFRSSSTEDAIKYIRKKVLGY